MTSEASSTPKLPLFSVQPMLLSEPSGMLTPPLQTSASVPFRWEEEPGKPRPCTALITLPVPSSKCLELPPRLQQMEYNSSLITKTPSPRTPTTVLEGPYVGRSVFSSFSFRFTSKRHDSFDSRLSMSPDKVQIGAVLLEKGSGHKGRGGLLGPWAQKQKTTLKGKNTKRELPGEDSFVFSSTIDAATCDESDCGTRVKMSKIRRNGSFSSVSHAKSHIWAAIYGGFKQAIPWKSKKFSTSETSSPVMVQPAGK